LSNSDTPAFPLGKAPSVATHRQILLFLPSLLQLLHPKKIPEISVSRRLINDCGCWSLHYVSWDWVVISEIKGRGWLLTAWKRKKTVSEVCNVDVGRGQIWIRHIFPDSTVCIAYSRQIGGWALDLISMAICWFYRIIYIERAAR